jgi:hypothetical protein
MTKRNANLRTIGNGFMNVRGGRRIPQSGPIRYQGSKKQLGRYTNPGFRGLGR